MNFSSFYDTAGKRLRTTRPCNVVGCENMSRAVIEVYDLHWNNTFDFYVCADHVEYYTMMYGKATYGFSVKRVGCSLKS